MELMKYLRSKKFSGKQINNKPSEKKEILKK
jgi:hypothetical protein